MTIASPPTEIEAALGRVDELADRTFAGWHVPGLAYGIVLNGELIHGRGLGTLRVAPSPGRDEWIEMVLRGLLSAPVVQ